MLIFTEIESWNRGDHELWNHEMRGFPVALFSRLFDFDTYTGLECHKNVSEWNYCYIFDLGGYLGQPIAETVI